MRRDDAALVDMLTFARQVVAFTAALDESTFAANVMVQAAVLHRLMLIGEIVHRVSRKIRLAHPEVPWVRISNQRNYLIHEYDDVRLPRIWRVVTQDVPALIKVLEPFVRSETPDRENT